MQSSIKNAAVIESFECFPNKDLVHKVQKILSLKIIYVLKDKSQQVNKTFWFAQVTDEKISRQKIATVLPNGSAKKDTNKLKKAQ